MQLNSFIKNHRINENLIAIDNILVSDEVLEKKFICNLKKCKGACCKAGDFGAPLNQEEVDIVHEIYPKIKGYLTKEGIKRIEESGLTKKYRKDQFVGTNLLDDGSCVFLNTNELGILECMFEKSFNEGNSNFKKPISCHLYPIRVIENPEVQLTAVNYDEWEICAPACELGEKENVPLYQFLKEALIRKFGQSFYEQLHGAFLFKQNK